MSFYKLPRILQWFSGNIGFHHIHHLSPRIPNYNLQKCHESHSMFEAVRPITLWSSLKSIGYRLWDEERRKLVGFGYVHVYLGKELASVPVPARFSQEANSLAHRVRSRR